MPLSVDQFWAFLLTALAVTASPGPDNLMVLGVGMSKGRRYGMMFGLGCALGCISHTVLAVLGVSALIMASPTAFTILKIAGGLYLLWLGIQALRSSGQVRAVAADVQPSMRELFLKGLVANAINPKVIMFFLAFLPQFVQPQQASVSLQMAALGLLFTLQAVLLFVALGFFAGSVGQWLNRRPRAGIWLDRLAGGVFVALGLRLLIAKP
ncbi:LysE family translocator [Paenalcaligenes sp. Me131]|uniref:LysE family translocator n=1 Tax=Paenalcaligenes sp. Me131 TaxID=3392636 RepID=UPI003D2C248A